ncbi:MAG: Hsp70 family protein [Planctomycetota bacterium]|nr:Hsp70 family protein [Planctomycetota bacterium]
MSAPLVGIDLGTTFSAIAYVNDDGVPEVIPNDQGFTTTPSVVLIEDGKIVVGEEALNPWVMNEAHVVRWVKRSIGNPDFRFQGMTASEISAEILKALKGDAERHFGQRVDEAVITCPAYFNSNEIENTRTAGELAGLRVREIVKEPTAAAVYYGLDNLSEGEKVMVCDLGGGTYDATILALENASFRPIASRGSRELGGHDWTEALRDLVAERFREKFGDDPRDDPINRNKLYQACEQAKRDLTRRPEVAVPCHITRIGGDDHKVQLLQGLMEQVIVTREDFEECTEDRIVRLVRRTEEALEKARLTWGDIDKTILVGGATRMPRVGDALEQASSKKLAPTGKRDLMVVLGAAILARGEVAASRARGLTEVRPRTARGLVEVDFLRINPRNLGTRVIDTHSPEFRVTNALIIPQGTGAPASVTQEFEISCDDQEVFDVPVVEFENDGDYDCLCSYRFTCLPGATRGDPIAITFNYDESSIVAVEAVDRKSGRALARERLEYVEPTLTPAAVDPAK